MASISEQLANVRTMEDVINLLMVLFTNLNNQNELYYDMFLNPTPMDLELERYDENGQLVTVIIPNRAKDILQTYSGEGNPNGSVIASQGALYIDTVSYSLYYKGYGTDSNGWILIYTARNLDYLSPTGDGSGLTNLNASSISNGTLSVARGGTGKNSISGLVKGNGTSPFSVAVDGTDYLGPESMTGIICYYPIYDTSLSNSGLPTGWLRCDGYDQYLRTDYPALFAKLGTKYGSSSSSTFAVPNMIDVYVKCFNGNSDSVGVKTSGQVGKHLHSYSGVTGLESAHTHTRGTMNITGGIDASTLPATSEAFGEIQSASITGAFTGIYGSQYACEDGPASYCLRGFTFNASNAWTGSTSGGSPHGHSYSGNTNYNSVGDTDKNEVDNITLVPIIKY